MTCLRLVLFFAIPYFFIQPASAQVKYFKLTDSGRYYFFNDASIRQNKIINGNNNYVRPITARTFFLQAENASLIPEGLTFAAFERMTIKEKQHLLDSVQHDYDWSKFQVNFEKDNAKAADEKAIKPDYSADTVYSISNLAFYKESRSLAGVLLSGMGRKQPFMIYPVGTRINKENNRWVIEWVELEPFLKRSGYENLNLPEQKIYDVMKKQGIDENTLNNLIN